jgi:membrane protein DedA with SNARE-associated domain
MHDIINYIVTIAEQFWYIWIFLMMVLESSFIPFPSEVAMIPAWYLASTWKMNFLIAFAAWTAWALIWATINYLIAYKLWEKNIIRLIRKFWKFFFIKESHYIKSENYFLEHWVITIFLARFITVVRQLISLPAWAFKMNFRRFFFYTWLWAWLWNLWLMAIWYIAWENKELISKYSYELLIGWILFIIIIWSIYYYLNSRKKVVV